MRRAFHVRSRRLHESLVIITYEIEIILHLLPVSNNLDTWTDMGCRIMGAYGIILHLLPVSNNLDTWTDMGCRIMGAYGSSASQVPVPCVRRKPIRTGQVESANHQRWRHQGCAPNFCHDRGEINDNTCIILRRFKIYCKECMSFSIRLLNAFEGYCMILSFCML